jgi:hypothetical protein
MNFINALQLQCSAANKFKLKIQTFALSFVLSVASRSPDAGPSSAQKKDRASLVSEHLTLLQAAPTVEHKKHYSRAQDLLLSLCDIV